MVANPQLLLSDNFYQVRSFAMHVPDEELWVSAFLIKKPGWLPELSARE